MRMEDFIDDEEIVITISHNSYVKRTPLTEYRRQGRGGKGAIGSSTRDEDFTEHIITASAHNYLLLFTDQGHCFWLRALRFRKEAAHRGGARCRTLSTFRKKKKSRLL